MMSPHLDDTAAMPRPRLDLRLLMQHHQTVVRTHAITIAQAAAHTMAVELLSRADPSVWARAESLPIPDAELRELMAASIQVRIRECDIPSVEILLADDLKKFRQWGRDRDHQPPPAAAPSTPSTQTTVQFIRPTDPTDNR